MYISYKTVYIYYKSIDELIEKVNSLGAKRIISIKSTTPKMTTTLLYCAEVYYEYYLDNYRT